LPSIGWKPMPQSVRVFSLLACRHPERLGYRRI
jgi:hypothetical protein